MKIGIAGYTGRVGQLLVQELLDDKHENASLAGGLSRKKLESSFFTTAEPKELFEVSDCVIDFTLPESTLINAEIAAKKNTPIVIGTTGLTAEQEKLLKDYAQKTTIVYAANMSLGVNLLMALVQKASNALDTDWDIEIFESHHKHKVDSPSGTALALGKSAAKGRGIDLPDNIKTDRSGVREKGEIGFSVARGGDVVGEHTVFFYAEGERIELAHKATNRSLFAKGAIKAALWCKGKENGLYSMQDVLGL